MGRLWYSRLTVTLAASQFLVPFVFTQDQPPLEASLLSSIASEAITITSESPTLTESTSSTPTPSREPQVHIVKTGAGGFKLDPQELHNVSVGDIVSFEFYPTGHSIARAEYASACSPYEYTGKGKVGFWSGEISVEDVDHLEYFNITINSTEPIFYYCGAETSCMVHHMVGAINPNSTQTLASQVHAAAMADYELLPGEPIPKEGASSSSTSSPTSTPTESSAPPPPSSNQGEDKLSTGAIVGIAIGVAAFIIACAALFFFVGRHGKLKEMVNRHNNNNNNNNNGPQDPNMAQQPYGDGGLASPQFTQQRYGTPPPGAHADYGFNSPPQYGIGEAYAGAWANPQQQHGHVHTMSQQQIEQLKYGQMSTQPAELHSPPLGQEAFRQELDASNSREERK